MPNDKHMELSLGNNIPNSVVGAVSSVIAAHYYSHITLNSLFMESGAPGDVPDGNCETKCSRWLQRCNEDPSINALEVLGTVIQYKQDTHLKKVKTYTDSYFEPHHLHAILKTGIYNDHAH